MSVRTRGAAATSVVLLSSILVVAAAGCSLDRASLGGGPATGMDAGPGVDAASSRTDTGVAPVDAFAPGVDARPTDGGPRPCPVACDGGRVCVDGTCVCPAGECCPGCTGGEVCSGGVCACPAGECCPGCETGQRCVSGTCMSEPCGRLDQPCCAGDTCSDDSTVCSGGGAIGPPRGCHHCGESAEPCCAGNTCNGGGSRVCGLGTCLDCGHRWQPCCAGGTCMEDSCRIGICRP